MHVDIGKFTIRDWTPLDAAAITTYANNRNIWISLRDGFPHPYGESDAEAFLTRVLNADPVTVFAIATDTEAIGSIGLMPGKDVHRFTAELGYWLAEPFWGKGIMTRAVRWITAHAFDKLGLHRVYAEPYAGNSASIRVLEKVGFQFEGILRSSVFKNGHILDQHIYSVVGDAAAESIAHREGSP